MRALYVYATIMVLCFVAAGVSTMIIGLNDVAQLPIPTGFDVKEPSAQGVVTLEVVPADYDPDMPT